MRPFHHVSIAVLAGSFVVSGCSSSNPDHPGPSFRSREALLTQAQTCEELESLLKADQLAKMNAQIDSMKRWAEHYDEGWAMAGEGDGAVGSATSGSSGSGAGPVSGEDDGSGSPPNDYSETNTQVEGVDEADIVKTDGERIYVLHGQQLAVVDAYPAADLSLASTVAVEGWPTEMFLADGKVVVFSSVDGAQIFQGAGIPAVSDYCGGYEGAYEGCAYYPSLTKVTVLALDDSGVNAAVESEYWFEGSYNSSRRVDNHVRAVLWGGQHGPYLEYWPSYSDSYPESSEDWKNALEVMRVKNTQKILGSKLADYLPHHFARIDGQVQALPTDCAGYLVPTEGTTEWGMTQVHALDLSAPATPPNSTSIVGYASTVYANEESLYLAAQGWKDPYLDQFSLDGEEMVSTSYTHVHKFDLTADPAKPQYAASGTVDGNVHNQFSLDEHAGVLRIATTDWVMSSMTSESRNHVFLMAEAGGTLEVLGALQHLAPNESIQSARFIGERGYVVTFRQVDPLFVLDLANPTQPQVLAELKIPGFSSYMHPLNGGSHLLTVGQDATDDGQVTGLAVQIFDVTDGTAPALTHKHVIPNASSDVGWDHKAFTFYGGMLAIPAWGWGDYDGWWSRLELFDVDADAGISARGSIDHSPFFAEVDQNGYCYGFGFDVRRSVFIEEALYSISYGGLIASNAQTLATLATLPLDEPTSDQCYYEEGF